MKVTRFEHDLCLQACQIISDSPLDSLTDHRLVTLNIVAGAYACNENVSRKHYDAAMKILEEIRNERRNAHA